MPQQNWLPDFIDQVPTIQLLDPLGAFLTGNADPAPVEYRFADVVKLSGHCCPTVAGAYAMTLKALRLLYPAPEIAVRGQIAVDCPGNPQMGALGPFSQVLSYLTGACGANGFQGLGGRFSRLDLLSFRGTGDGRDPFLFRRTDNGQQVSLIYASEQLPGDPQLGSLLTRGLEGVLDAAELEEMGSRWQARIRHLLLSAEQRDAMIQEYPLPLYERNMRSGGDLQ